MHLNHKQFHQHRAHGISNPSDHRSKRRKLDDGVTSHAVIDITRSEIKPVDDLSDAPTDANGSRGITASSYDQQPPVTAPELELRQLQATLDSSLDLDHAPDIITEHSIATTIPENDNEHHAVKRQAVSVPGLGAGATIPQPAADTKGDVSKAEANLPGLTEPPPAIAAQEARTKALAAQEQAAEQKNTVVPSDNGPPPPPVAAPAAAAAVAAAGDVSKQHGGASLANNAVSQKVLAPSAASPAPSPSAGIPVSNDASRATPSALQPSRSLNGSPVPTGEVPTAQISAFPANGNRTTSAISSAMSSSNSASMASLASMDSMSSAILSSALAAMTSESMSLSAAAAASASQSLLSSPTPTSDFASASQASQSGALASSSTNTGVVAAGGSPTSSGTAASSSSASAGSGGSPMPPARELAGGIVGGVAGVVLILAALLFLLRWRRNKKGVSRNISPPVPVGAGAGSAALGAGGTMTQRSSNVPIVAAGFFNRLRPSSTHTATTAATNETGPSERGFQKISGRKLPSVLHSGGDGYTAAATGGGAAGAAGAAGLAVPPQLRPPTSQSLSGSSFYRDSHGFYGGAGPVTEELNDPAEDGSASPLSSSPTYSSLPPAGLAAAGRSPGHSSPGLPNIQPGPARRPVINQGGIMPLRTPPRDTTSSHSLQAHSIPENPFASPRDALGRSHPSQDGSRQSRFKESTTPP